MSPAIAAAFQRVSLACSTVQASLSDHRQIQMDLQLLEKKLTPRAKREAAAAAPAPTKKR